MLSVVVAVVLSFLAVIPFPVSMNPTLQLVSTPSVIGILLSVFVGAAAALTFVTGLRDEIAGVAVAIALVPPIASIGLGLKMADMALVKNASTVASNEYAGSYNFRISVFYSFRFKALYLL